MVHGKLLVRMDHNICSCQSAADALDAGDIVTDSFNHFSF